MELLTAVLAILVAIAILFEIARRVGRAVSDAVRARRARSRVRSRPAPDRARAGAVLLVFLPPLLFGAAVETPIRDLRANLGAAPAPVDRPGRSSRWRSSPSWPTAADPGPRLGRRLRARGDRGTDRRPGRHDRVPPARRTAHRRDPRRGRGAVQRCDGARRLPGRGGGRGRAGRSSCPNALAGVRGRGGRRCRDRRGRGAGRSRDPAAARRPAGRGRDLDRDPVRRLPAGRAARAVRRRWPRSTAGLVDRQPPGHDPDAEQPGAVATAAGRWSASSSTGSSSC